MAKGGGSANKSFLFQKTKALLNDTSLREFLDESLRAIGTSACPPYHLAVVIGGTSAEFTLKTAKYASAHYLDSLPTSGDASTGHGFRDLEWEEKILEQTRDFGIGAQFGGKYFCHDVRVIRLPRHGASNPVGLAVSCSADRRPRRRSPPTGSSSSSWRPIPARFLPESDRGRAVRRGHHGRPRPADGAIRNQLTQYPVKTRLSLSGTLVVGRDIAHAKIKERLDAGEAMPDYLRDHPIYYAGPAKTPEGHTRPAPSGPPPPAGWTPTSISSRRPAARW